MLLVLKTLIKFCGALLLIILAQIVASYLLPSPFNQINLALLLFLWLVVYRGNLAALWLALFVSLANDLFSSLPFGLTAVAMIAAVLGAKRTFEIFPNFTWYNIFFLGAFGIFYYKIFSYLFLLSRYFIYKRTNVIQPPNLSNLTTEILLNALALLAAYAISLLFTKRKIAYHSL